MFVCKSCDEKLTNSKMFGLVIGQIGREKFEQKGLAKGDVLAGALSGFRIACPNCSKTNWNYQA